MHILVVGLNYKTAPVDIREKFAFQSSMMPQALEQLLQTKSILECVIVGTCNRTELYVIVDKLDRAKHYVRGFLESWFGIPRAEFRDFLYMHSDQTAIEHLFKVACGLDSMVIGETQILGQVRDAFLFAQSQKVTGTMFNTLFKQAITLAKRAHSETSVGEHAVSVSYAAIELGKRIFGSYKDKTVMILGAGKMSELTATHLNSQGVGQVVVLNRTLERAVELANKYRGKAYPMEKLEDVLMKVDIIISSTGSSEYVLTHSLIEKMMGKRKSKPLFMIDIAVPRDIEPTIHSIPNVFLYDIDDLQGIVDCNLAERQKEALKIEQMIKQEITVFNQWYKMLGVSPVIKALQEKANDVHTETMDSLLKKLPHLDERERKVIHKLTKSMMNQLLRDPIVRIKDMAAESKGDELVTLFTETFALEDVLEQSAQKDKNRAKEESINIIPMHSREVVL